MWQHFFYRVYSVISTKFMTLWLGNKARGIFIHISQLIWIKMHMAKFLKTQICFVFPVRLILCTNGITSSRKTQLFTHCISCATHQISRIDVRRDRLQGNEDDDLDKYIHPFPITRRASSEMLLIWLRAASPGRIYVIYLLARHLVGSERLSVW